ncbi:hypothetical protein CC2G_013767 [Coprinopsis cinerea AmutBmut pab1-1]|nr:hypothetical protein CC2G_013767 [Coprinopsis cinerea AmutBmut pab1-1]
MWRTYKPTSSQDADDSNLRRSWGSWSRDNPGLGGLLGLIWAIDSAPEYTFHSHHVPPSYSYPFVPQGYDDINHADVPSTEPSPRVRPSRPLAPPSLHRCAQGCTPRPKFAVSNRWQLASLVPLQTP